MAAQVESRGSKERKEATWKNAQQKQRDDFVSSCYFFFSTVDNKLEFGDIKIVYFLSFVHMIYSHFFFLFCSMAD